VGIAAVQTSISSSTATSAAAAAATATATTNEKTESAAAQCVKLTVCNALDSPLLKDSWREFVEVFPNRTTTYKYFIFRTVNSANVFAIRNLKLNNTTFEQQYASFHSAKTRARERYGIYACSLTEFVCLFEVTNKQQGGYHSVCFDMCEFFRVIGVDCSESAMFPMMCIKSNFAAVFREIYICMTETADNFGNTFGPRTHSELIQKIAKELKVASQNFSDLAETCYHCGKIEKHEIQKFISDIQHGIISVDAHLKSEVNHAFQFGNNIVKYVTDLHSWVHMLCQQRNRYSMGRRGRVVVKMATFLFQEFNKQLPNALCDGTASLCTPEGKVALLRILMQSTQFQLVLHANRISPSFFVQSFIDKLIVAARRNRFVICSGQHRTGKTMICQAIVELLHGKRISIDPNGGTVRGFTVASASEEQNCGVAVLEDVHIKQMKDYVDVVMRPHLDGDKTVGKEIFKAPTVMTFPPTILTTNVPLYCERPDMNHSLWNFKEQFCKNYVEPLPPHEHRSNSVEGANLFSKRFLGIEFRQALETGLGNIHVDTLCEKDLILLLLKHSLPTCPTRYGVEHVPNEMYPCRGADTAQHHPFCLHIMKQKYFSKCDLSKFQDSNNNIFHATYETPPEHIGYFFPYSDYHSVTESMMCVVLGVHHAQLADPDSVQKKNKVRNFMRFFWLPFCLLHEVAMGRSPVLERDDFFNKIDDLCIDDLLRDIKRFFLNPLVDDEILTIGEICSNPMCPKDIENLQHCMIPASVYSHIKCEDDFRQFKSKLRSDLHETSQNMLSACLNDRSCHDIPVSKRPQLSSIPNLGGKQFLNSMAIIDSFANANRKVVSYGDDLWETSVISFI
jgi:hypothetical protein